MYRNVHPVFGAAKRENLYLHSRHGLSSKSVYKRGIEEIYEKRRYINRNCKAGGFSG